MAMVVAWSIKWAEVKQHPVKAFGEVPRSLDEL